MSAYGLHSQSTTDDFVAAINAMAVEAVSYQLRIADLEGKLRIRGQADDKRKDWIELKSYSSLSTFGGSEKEFHDWEFKLQRFVKPFKTCEQWLDWIKDQDTEITKAMMDQLKQEAAYGDPSIDLEWYDEQLYDVLCLLCEGTPLNTVKNQRENVGFRGANSWYKLTREVAGRTGARLERLADLVHNPKPITSYKDGLAQMEKWESQRLELEKLEGQGLSDLTKRTTLKKMIPADLIRDLERDKSLKTWESAWEFVIEKIPLRKDWGVKKKGINDMDVDLAENKAEEDRAGEGGPEVLCQPCDGDLDTLKGGGGKGQPFQGNCSFCGVWGHRLRDCRKYTAHLQEKGKGKKGEGDQKGKGQSKGYQPWKGGGGWQQKGGGRAPGKGGYGKNNKGGGGGFSFNIDGDENWSGQWSGNYGWDNGFFMLEAVDDDSDDALSGDELFGLESDVRAVSKQSFYDWKSCDHVEHKEDYEELQEKVIGRLPWSQNDLAAGLIDAVESPTLSAVSPITIQSSEGYATRGAADAGGDSDSADEFELPVFGELHESGAIPNAAESGVSSDGPRRCVEDLERVIEDTSFGEVEEYHECLEFVFHDCLDEVEEAESEAGECPNELVDSSSEDDGSGVSKTDQRKKRLTKTRRGYDKVKLADLDRGVVSQTASEVSEVDMNSSLEELFSEGSVGSNLPTLTSPGSGSTTVQDASRQTPEAKPVASVKVGTRRFRVGRRHRWKSKQTQRKLNFELGEFEDFKQSAKAGKDFLRYTVGELKEMVESKVEADSISSCSEVPSGDGEDFGCAVEPRWYDAEAFTLYDDDSEDNKVAEHSAMTLSWRSEPETWEQRKWVKVDSVVDSGASAPVAPPSMAPNVPIQPSEGSRRGQKFTSASKHKIKNLGQQSIKACTEEGAMTNVLFQVAEVTKPLVSVSALCEKGNRVIFGKAGGVVQNLRTGRETPFYKRNGIYVLSMWLLDEDEQAQPFHRP